MIALTGEKAAPSRRPGQVCRREVIRVVGGGIDIAEGRHADRAAGECGVGSSRIADIILEAGQGRTITAQPEVGCRGRRGGAGRQGGRAAGGDLFEVVAVPLVAHEAIVGDGRADRAAPERADAVAGRAGTSIYLDVVVVAIKRRPDPTALAIKGGSYLSECIAGHSPIARILGPVGAGVAVCLGEGVANAGVYI